MPDPTPATPTPPAPAPVAPKPAPARPTPPPAPKPAPEPAKVADEIANENTIQVWFEPERGLWYARIGPDRLGIQGQGHDPNEAIAECATGIYRGGWIFDPSWKPKDA